MADRESPAWSLVTEHAPEAGDPLLRAVALAPGVVEEGLVELSRLRIAQLLGRRDADSLPAGDRPATAETLAKAAAVAQWPTSPLFTDSERAALALTEQFVIDVAGVTDEQTESLLAHLGPAGLQGFVQALYVTDMTMRLEMSLERVFPGTEEEP